MPVIDNVPFCTVDKFDRHFSPPATPHPTTQAGPSWSENPERQLAERSRRAELQTGNSFLAARRDCGYSDAGTQRRARARRAHTHPTHHHHPTRPNAQAGTTGTLGGPSKAIAPLNTETALRTPAERNTGGRGKGYNPTPCCRRPGYGRGGGIIQTPSTKDRSTPKPPRFNRLTMFSRRSIIEQSSQTAGPH